MLRKTLILLVIGVVSALWLGCAQNTESGQGLISPLGQRMGQGTQLTLEFDIDNGPDGARGGLRGPASQPGEGWGQGLQVDRVAEDGGTKANFASGGFNQLVIIWNDLGTEVGGSQTGSQAQTASQAQTPTQDIKPTVNVPIAVTGAPGSRVTLESPTAGNQSTATGGDDQIDQSGATTLTELKVLKDQFAQALEVLKGVLAAALPGPASQPAGE